MHKCVWLHMHNHLMHWKCERLVKTFAICKFCLNSSTWCKPLIATKVWCISDYAAAFASVLIIASATKFYPVLPPPSIVLLCWNKNKTRGGGRWESGKSEANANANEGNCTQIYFSLRVYHIHDIWTNVRKMLNLHFNFIPFENSWNRIFHIIRKCLHRLIFPFFRPSTVYPIGSLKVDYTELCCMLNCGQKVCVFVCVVKNIPVHDHLVNYCYISWL